MGLNAGEGVANEPPLVLLDHLEPGFAAVEGPNGHYKGLVGIFVDVDKARLDAEDTARASARNFMFSSQFNWHRNGTQRRLFSDLKQQYNET